MNKRVFVAMSGGVDSSVAALLLGREGYAATGVFMRCYNLDGCAERDAEDARRAAEHIGIPFYVWDFEEEYKKRVVDYMVEGYKAGITPNPDVMCNREIKFGLFYDRATALGADFVATGHYVRLTRVRGSRPDVRGKLPIPKYATSNIFCLSEAKDKNKDQSYFLWAISPEKLAYCLFPIGDYLKPEVRAIARKAGLPTAEKKDSQGICFLGQVALEDFLSRYIRPKKGEIKNIAGETVGAHRGAQFYTIGQRHGLGVGDRRRATGDKSSLRPLYVVEKDAKTNTLVVAEGENDPALYRKKIRVRGLNLFLASGKGGAVLARVRYRQPLAEAKIKFGGDEAEISFKKPQKFVAPGQSAVWYSKSGRVLGGGVII